MEPADEALAEGHVEAAGDDEIDQWPEGAEAQEEDANDDPDLVLEEEARLAAAANEEEAGRVWDDMYSRVAKWADTGALPYARHRYLVDRYLLSVRLELVGDRRWCVPAVLRLCAVLFTTRHALELRERQDIVEVLSKYASGTNGEPQLSMLALTALRNLAKWRDYLSDLDRGLLTNSSVVMLRDASHLGRRHLIFGILCRLCGKLESNTAIDFTSPEYVLLLTDHASLLDSALDAGVDGWFFDAQWNTVELMYDFLQVATADVNKSKLGFLVSICIKGLEKRGRSVKMVQYAVATLSQLMFEPDCTDEFIRNRRRLLKTLDQLLPSLGADTVRDVTSLKQSLQSLIKLPSNHLASEPLVFIGCLPGCATFARQLAEEVTKIGIKPCFPCNDVSGYEGAFAGVVLVPSPAHSTSDERNLVKKYDEQTRSHLTTLDWMSGVIERSDANVEQLEEYYSMVLSKAHFYEVNHTTNIQGQVHEIVDDIIEVKNKFFPPPEPRLTEGGDSNLVPILSALLSRMNEMKQELESLRSELVDLKSQNKGYDQQL